MLNNFVWLNVLIATVILVSHVQNKTLKSSLSYSSWTNVWVTIYWNKLCSHNQSVSKYLPPLAPLKNNRNNKYWLIIPIWLFDIVRVKKQFVWYLCRWSRMLSGIVNALLLICQEDVFLTLCCWILPTGQQRFFHQMILYLIHEWFTGHLVRWRSCPFWWFFFTLSTWNPDENKDLTFLIWYTEVLPLTNLGGVAGLDFKRKWTLLMCRKFNAKKKCTTPCWHRVQPKTFTIQWCPWGGECRPFNLCFQTQSNFNLDRGLVLQSLPRELRR